MIATVKTVVAKLNHDIYCRFISLMIINCINNKDQDC